jgi:ribosomal protein L21E
MVFGKEMRRYEILPIAMRERAQVEEEAIEEDLFGISEAEEQLLSDQIRRQEFSTANSSHNSPQPQHDSTNSSDSSNDYQHQDQQQRDKLHEVARKNQAHANRKAIKEYSKCHTITTFKEGDHVSIAVPPHDRGPTDPKRIFGKILVVDENKPDHYQVIIPYGVLDRLLPIKSLLPLPSTIPLKIPTGRMKSITLAHAARQESTSSAIPVVCSCKKGCKNTRCQCKKHKQKCSIACHEEGINCGNLSSLATRTEKGIVQQRAKRKRANTGRLSIHWQEDEHSVEGDDSEEDELAERELE